MIDLVFWAKLPLHLGFPSVTKPLLSIKATIDGLHSKIDKMKKPLDELATRTDFDAIVLKSYETELDLISAQLVESRHRLIKAAVDIASTKLNEALQALLDVSETVNEVRLKKFTIVCRALLKQLMLQLKAELDDDEQKWVRGLLEVVVRCVHEIYRHQNLKPECLNHVELDWKAAGKTRPESVFC